MHTVHAVKVELLAGINLINIHVLCHVFFFKREHVCRNSSSLPSSNADSKN